MSTAKSPEKIDTKPNSTIVNTSTQPGNNNLNVVVNKVQNQPIGLSSESDIEIIPPEKIVPKKIFEKTQYCRVVPHYKTKLTPFEAYHGKEHSTAFANLTKKNHRLKNSLGRM